MKRTLGFAPSLSGGVALACWSGLQVKNAAAVAASGSKSSHSLFARSLSSQTTSSQQPPRRMGQPHPSTHAHLLKPGEVTPGITAEEYEERRLRFVEQLPAGAIALVPSNPERIMSNDIPYRFRQHTDFYYLCGYDEPDAFLLLKKQNTNEVHMSMFVRPRDPKREIWDGPRSGLEGAVEFFGADEAFSIEHHLEELPKLLSSASVICFDADANMKATEKLAPYLLRVEGKEIKNPKKILESMRLVKSPAEIAIMRRSTHISAQAFKEVMKDTKPGMTENVIEAMMEYEVRKRGALRLAYPPVIASGEHANILHYIANDDILKEGDLLLVDAGGEYCNFSSDITRTWPISGKFSAAQKELYEALLEVQLKCIDKCRVGHGMSPLELHHYSAELMADLLIKLGLSQDSASTIIKRRVPTFLLSCFFLLSRTPNLTPTTTKSYVKFYPHSIGHWLGMDVHDVHSISTATPFRPGMMCTVEPGIYIPSDMQEDIPARYRGIGIRIEDDLVIREDGEAPEVLTWEAPKTVQEIESVMQA
ncbi:Xaa-Pro aminopeptidase [Balamuthia mandrillaris]